VISAAFLFVPKWC